MNLFSMAWRNVWRNRRRSLVTISAMAFALFVELLYAGLIPGMLEGMQEDITDLELGDIQVHSADYLERPSLYTSIPGSDALVAKIEEAGYAASPRLLGGGLAAAGEFSAGVALRGVDVERDARVTQVDDLVADGEWLDPADPNGVVLGKGLARILGVKPGDELVVLTSASDGSMGNDLYTVRGVLHSIASGSDRTTIYVPEAAFRDLFVFPTGAHQLIVALPDDADLATAKETIAGLAAGMEGDPDVMTWRELMPIVAQMLDSTQGMVYVIFFIVYIAVGILILNAMLMAVFERIREFGVLKAIGVGPTQVLRLILYESSIQVVIAAVVGFTLALPGMWFLSTKGIDAGGMAGMDMMGVAMRPIWYGIYRPDVVAGPLIMLFVVVGMAIVYPALKAAFIRPVKAMTHQ